jgi:3-oxoacyl-[acyl-carrier protein] reductase
MRLKGKVALITVASIGIGRAEAILFAKEGAKIVTADINDTGGKETADIIKANGGECSYYHTDVTKAAEVKELIKKTIRKHNKIDILINDVGIPQKPTPVEDFPEELWDRVHDVNIKSVFLTIKYVVPNMKKAGGGVIINTSTMNSVRPHVGHCALTSAKNSVIAITKELALELAPSKIRVNCISPWTIDTPSFQNSLSEKEKRSWINEIPLGRIGKPEDIANAALYLASDESSWVTGINLPVDGGYGI